MVLAGDYVVYSTSYASKDHRTNSDIVTSLPSAATVTVR
jgi:hypothetical protein